MILSEWVNKRLLLSLLSKFTYKKNKNLRKITVRNFGQKHEIQYLEKYAM